MKNTFERFTTEGQSARERKPEQPADRLRQAPVRAAQSQDTATTAAVEGDQKLNASHSSCLPDTKGRSRGLEQPKVLLPKRALDQSSPHSEGQ